MKIIFALLILSFSFSVLAQTRIVSVDAYDLSYTGGLLIKSDNGKSEDREQIKFRLNLNYAENWEKYVGVMWKARVFINRDSVDFGSNDTLETSWGGAGGFIYNFNSDNIKESYFASASVGLERATYEVGSTDDESGFNIFGDLEGGKRFDLGQYSVANISFAPSVALTLKRYGGDIRDTYYKNGSELKLNFLKFDILF
jgi:hypothetical protein